jgi:hypothetical protein
VNSSITDADRAERPPLSVVVASLSDGSILYRCLDGLIAEIAPANVEVVVARDIERTDGFDRAAAARRFPRVRWIDAPPGCTVPRLRTLGIAACQGDAVALLEDDCLVQPGWCKAAMSITGSGYVAIGGAVEPSAYGRALDWGVYFCEYARFMLPVPKGESPPLPGNNAVYTRNALLQLPPSAQDGFQEVFVQAEWRRTGMATGASDALVVKNINSWPIQQMTSVPFHHARAYAARRFQGQSLAARLPIALMTVVLPVVKTYRLLAESAGRGRLLGPLMRALPWVLTFNSSWSVGEAIGCVFGPGSSGDRWR